MQCKKCHTRINYEVAAETLASIKNACEQAGMSQQGTSLYATDHGPLCRKCIEIWEADCQLLRKCLPR
jgi:hypothetical protein